MSSTKMEMRMLMGEKVGVIMIGNSGSGKSSLTKMFSRIGIGFGYLGTGERLRKLLSTSPDFAKIINAYTSTGDHVPWRVMRPLVSGWFKELVEYRVVISDGFPRNGDQIDDALTLFHTSNFLKVATIYVDTPASTCAHRLITQARESEQDGSPRDDCSERAITDRLKTFSDKVEPILHILRERCSNYVHVKSTEVDLRDPLIVKDVAERAGLIKC